MIIIKSNDEIYPIVTEALGKATKLMTCADLMGVPDVFNAALARWGNDKVKASEKLSDTLRYMWVRGALDRFPAPPSHSMARYAYALAGRFGNNGEVKLAPPSPATKNKGDMTVVERDGEVVIELKDFTIVIKPK